MFQCQWIFDEVLSLNLQCLFPMIFLWWWLQIKLIQLIFLDWHYHFWTILVWLKPFLMLLLKFDFFIFMKWVNYSLAMNLILVYLTFFPIHLKCPLIFTSTFYSSLPISEYCAFHSSVSYANLLFKGIHFLYSSCMPQDQIHP